MSLRSQDYAELSADAYKTPGVSYHLGKDEGRLYRRCYL